MDDNDSTTVYVTSRHTYCDPSMLYICIPKPKKDCDVAEMEIGIMNTVASGAENGSGRRI